MKKAFSSVVLSLIVLCAFVLVCSANRGEKTEVKRRVSSPQAAASIAAAATNDRLDAWREAHLRLLESYVKGDREAEEMLQFHCEHGKYALIVRDGMFVPSRVDMSRITREAPKEVRDDIRDYLVTVSIPEERLRAGFNVRGSCQFSGQENTLFIVPPETQQSVWAMVTLLHEIRHAYDLNTGLEPPRSEGRDWLMGEYRAYTLEFRILDMATDGGWSRMLDTMVDNLPPVEDAGSMFGVNPTSKAFAFVKSQFPPAHSETENTLRNGAVIIGVNFRFADRNHLPLDWKLRMIGSASH